MNEQNEQSNYLKGIIEALLFISEKPLTIDQIKSAMETVGAVEIKSLIEGLKSDYESRQSGVIIKEIAGGYQMLSNPQCASYIRNLYKTKHKEKLSKPALETLAIIAYKQPVTRADIELIRGVNTDGVFMNLIDKELIKIVGRKDVAGRPFMYGTTKQFLDYFGLRSLENLPRLEEFPQFLQAKENEMAEEAAQSQAATESVAQISNEAVADQQVQAQTVEGEAL